MVERGFAKAKVRVQFPLLAPIFKEMYERFTKESIEGLERGSQESTIFR